MGVEGNKTDSINAENTNTGTENANTDKFGNTADESTNKGTPTLKEPPSGRTDVQPPEDMNLQSYSKLKIFFYMHFTH